MNDSRKLDGSRWLVITSLRRTMGNSLRILQATMCRCTTLTSQLFSSRLVMSILHRRRLAILAWDLRSDYTRSGMYEAEDPDKSGSFAMFKHQIKRRLRSHHCNTNVPGPLSIRISLNNKNPWYICNMRAITPSRE